MATKNELKDGMTHAERALHDYRCADDKMDDVQKHLGAKGLLKKAILACEKWRLSTTLHTPQIVLYLSCEARKLFTVNVTNRFMGLLRKNSTVTFVKFIIVKENGKLESEPTQGFE
jgi:hypothetical protein